jgi:hypothetical protein
VLHSLRRLDRPRLQLVAVGHEPPVGLAKYTS